MIGCRVFHTKLSNLVKILMNYLPNLSGVLDKLSRFSIDSSQRFPSCV
jgi:hypothetical protein